VRRRTGIGRGAPEAQASWYVSGVSSERAQQEGAEPPKGTAVSAGRTTGAGDAGDTGESMTENAIDGAQATAKPKAAPRRTSATTAAAAAGTSTRAPRKRTAPAKPRATATAAATAEPAPLPDTRSTVLAVTGLRKRFGDTLAVDDVGLDVREGSFYGIVGPNGAGKTTTLSMITGLLRPDAGSVVVHGVDAWADPVRAKHVIGVLPDRLRLFDRLTGAQLLQYAGTLRGLNARTVRARSTDLASAFGIEDALDRLVADYSAGMTKKIALAAAMIHSPRLLVLDEPFESVDPVSAANVVDILQRYTAAGGTVVLSSHGMDMIQRVCDSVAIIVRGQVLAAGTIDEVRGGGTLEERFVDLAGGRKAAEGMEWLHSFSD
jgi:ABC-2 type transport system ATP-binding protein